MQSFIDSFTRCFNPLDGSVCTTVTQAVVSTASKSSKLQTQGNTHSTTTSDRQARHQHKKEPETPHKYDPDRYIHRKLTIFRLRSDDELDQQIMAARKQAANKKRNNELINSDDYEIEHLTKQREADAKRDHKEKDDPFSLVSLLCKTTPFLGLCFAKPVREDDNIDNLPDWKLTAEEFEARQRAQAEMAATEACHADMKGCLDYNDDLPHVEESSASSCYCEDEDTITSASYFDQKYSHVAETSPPIPLYFEQRVVVSEYETREIHKLMERRRMTKRARLNPTSGGRLSPVKCPKNPRGEPSTSKTPCPDTTPKIKKNNSRALSLGLLGSGKRSKNRKQRRLGSRGKSKINAVPEGKSSSVSSGSGSYNTQGRCAEPDIVHSTAAI